MFKINKFELLTVLFLGKATKRLDNLKKKNRHEKIYFTISIYNPY